MGGRFQNETEIYTIATIIIKYADRTHRNDLAIYTIGKTETENDLGLYPEESERRKRSYHDNQLPQCKCKSGV